MKKRISILLMMTVTACSAPESRRQTYDLINSEMKQAAGTQKPTSADAVSQALLPPLNVETPKVQAPIEERFSLALNNVPAQQFFLAIASGTRYNMLVHPQVSGLISANLKDVTLFEALDAIRDIYGYDYEVNGNRIVVKPLTLQTRIFQVNYLSGSRRGYSDTRVSSGSVADVRNNNSNSQSNTSSDNVQDAGNNSNNQSSQVVLESSKVTTQSSSDFWGELKAALDAIVGNQEGRSVVISPQSGVVVVRGMPDELRSVAGYLNATQLSVDRQVILEAKILEVQLNDSYKTGINWASFASFKGINDNRTAVGFLAPGSTLSSSADSTVLTTGGAAGLTANTSLSMTVPENAGGSLFGLALQTKNFAALLSFLETQGTVHVLSSPRIATLNNQKAVLKVGTDEFFVTSVSSTTTTGTSTTTTPSVKLQPFFSGVVLDVTPQIDDHGNIILHIRPSVSQVSTVNKQINLGSFGGTLNLPLASSNTSETDSVVRGTDGHVVAIGGLMRQASVYDRSQLPGAGDTPVLGGLFRNTAQTTQKRELVILLRPTIVQSNSNWTQDILQSQGRIEGLAPRYAGAAR